MLSTFDNRIHRMAGSHYGGKGLPLWSTQCGQTALLRRQVTVSAARPTSDTTGP